MDEDEINYRVLRKIQKREQNSPKLSELKYTFYKDVLEYLKNLEKRLDKETSPQKKKILEEEVGNTKKIFLNIYEQREKKILLTAISKARGGKPSIENMVNLEKNLFEEILSIINESRNNVLSEKNEKINDGNELKKNTKKEKKPKKSSKDIRNDNPLIRIKEDVPEFIGTDKKKYDLKKNDVLSITPDMCKLLCKRERSEKIEM